MQISEKAHNSEAKIRVTRTTTWTENYVTQHEPGQKLASIMDQKWRQSWTKNGVNRGPKIVSIEELNSRHQVHKLDQNTTSLQIQNWDHY